MAVTNYDMQKLGEDEQKLLNAITAAYNQSQGVNDVDTMTGLAQMANQIRMTASGGGYLADNSGVYNGVNAASDGKFYLTGGSGKEFVFNPETANIGIREGDAIRYVLKGDDNYGVTFSAMQADTGLNLTGIKDMSYAADYAGQMVSNDDALKNIYDTRDAELNKIRAQAEKVYQDSLIEQAKIKSTQASANKDLYTGYTKQSDLYGVHGERLAMLGLSSSGYADTESQKLLDNYNELVVKNELSTLDMLAALQRATAAALDKGDLEAAATGQKYYTLISNQMLVNQKALDTLSGKYLKSTDVQTDVQKEEKTGGSVDRNTDNSLQITKESNTAANNTSNNTLPSSSPAVAGNSSASSNSSQSAGTADVYRSGEDDKIGEKEFNNSLTTYYSPAVALSRLRGGQEADASLIYALERYYNAPYEFLLAVPDLKLSSDYSLSGSGTLPFKIKNSYDGNGMVVTGLGKLSYSELLDMLTDGEVVCLKENGAYNFQKK